MRGTQTIDLSAAGAVVDEETITLAGGESRQISLAWQTLPTDVGEVELAAASETDTATTTVRVLDAETDAVAYLDRDGDGSADETFTAAEMAFLNDLNGRFVVFDDARVAGSVAVDADRIAVEEDVTLSATAIELVGEDGVSLGEGSTLDTSSEWLFGSSTGDVTVRSDGRIDARGVSVTTAARALFGASAGDIDISAEGDVDVIQGPSTRPAKRCSAPVTERSGSRATAGPSPRPVRPSIRIRRSSPPANSSTIDVTDHRQSHMLAV